jgi:hypothetical protein
VLATSFPKRGEGLGDVVAVPARIYLLEHARNFPLRIDQERRASDAHALESEDVLLNPHAVSLGNRVILVDEQRERQTVLCLERAV